MISRARTAFPSVSVLSFMVMDARALSFEQPFNVIFSNAALHWVKDHRTLLRGVADSLKPGGRILFQMGGRGNGEEIFSVAAQVARKGAWQDCFRGFEFPWGFYGPDEYIPWLKEAGGFPGEGGAHSSRHETERARRASWLGTNDMDALYGKASRKHAGEVPHRVRGCVPFRPSPDAPGRGGCQDGTTGSRGRKVVRIENVKSGNFLAASCVFVRERRGSAELPTGAVDPS